MSPSFQSIAESQWGRNPPEKSIHQQLSLPHTIITIAKGTGRQKCHTSFSRVVLPSYCKLYQVVKFMLPWSVWYSALCTLIGLRKWARKCVCVQLCLWQWALNISFLLLPFLPSFKRLSMQTNCFSDNSQWAQILLLLFTNVFMKAQAILAIMAIFYSLRCVFLVLVVATIQLWKCIPHSTLFGETKSQTPFLLHCKFTR